MSLALLAAAALLLGHLVRSRATREQRHHQARELRRNEREQQWRAMILDAERDHLD